MRKSIMKNIINTMAVTPSNTTVKVARQKGMTLVELMASMGIAAGIVVGALSLYNVVSDGQKANQMVQDIDAMRSIAKRMYESQGNYTGLNNTLLISSGKIPTTLRSDATGGTIKSRDGYDFTIAAGATAGTFTISLAGAPAVMCKEITTKFSGYESLAIGAAGANTALPITPPTANTQCSADALAIVLTSR